MTPAEFLAVVAAHPGLQQRVRDAAQAVLVDGVSITAAAKRAEFTKQRLAKALDRLDPLRLPPGWVRRWVALPEKEMNLVEAMERAARRRLQGGDDS